MLNWWLKPTSNVSRSKFKGVKFFKMARIEIRPNVKQLQDLTNLPPFEVHQAPVFQRCATCPNQPAL